MDRSIDEQEMSEGSQAKLEQLSKYIQSSSPDVPAYCLLKVEEKGWVFVSYIPDTAKVKEKMVYASSREKVKKVGFGNSPGRSIDQSINQSINS